MARLLWRGQMMNAGANNATLSHLPVATIDILIATAAITRRMADWAAASAADASEDKTAGNVPHALLQCPQRDVAVKSPM